MFVYIPEKQRPYKKTFVALDGDRWKRSNPPSINPSQRRATRPAQCTQSKTKDMRCSAVPACCQIMNTLAQRVLLNYENARTARAAKLRRRSHNQVTAERKGVFIDAQGVQAPHDIERVSDRRCHTARTLPIDHLWGFREGGGAGHVQH